MKLNLIKKRPFRKNDDPIVNPKYEELIKFSNRMNLGINEQENRFMCAEASKENIKSKDNISKIFNQTVNSFQALSSANYGIKFDESMVEDSQI
jgi:hypothetical protein